MFMNNLHVESRTVVSCSLFSTLFASFRTSYALRVFVKSQRYALSLRKRFYFIVYFADLEFSLLQALFIHTAFKQKPNNIKANVKLIKAF
jgi:hypothetical protein